MQDSAALPVPTCVDCGNQLPKKLRSQRQPAGERRCKACAARGHGGGSGRCNDGGVSRSSGSSSASHPSCASTGSLAQHVAALEQQNAQLKLRNAHLEATHRAWQVLTGGDWSTFVVINIVGDQKLGVEKCELQRGKVIVSEIAAGSIAARRGIRVGSCLLTFQNERCTTWPQVVRTVRSTPRPWRFVFAQLPFEAPVQPAAEPEPNTAASDPAVAAESEPGPKSEPQPEPEPEPEPAVKNEPTAPGRIFSFDSLPAKVAPGATATDRQSVFKFRAGKTVERRSTAAAGAQPRPQSPPEPQPVAEPHAVSSTPFAVPFAQATEIPVSPHRMAGTAEKAMVAARQEQIRRLIDLQVPTSAPTGGPLTAKNEWSKELRGNTPAELRPAAAGPEPEPAVDANSAPSPQRVTFSFDSQPFDAKAAPRNNAAAAGQPIFEFRAGKTVEQRTAAVGPQPQLFQATEEGRSTAEPQLPGPSVVFSDPMTLGTVPDEIAARICTNLGVKELGRLACVSRRFTQPATVFIDPGTGAKLSVVEEGARQQALVETYRHVNYLECCCEDECDGLCKAQPTFGTDEPWLRALWRLRHPLLFTKTFAEEAYRGHGHSITPTLSDGGHTATIPFEAEIGGEDNTCFAVCESPVMTSGIHYAEFLTGGCDGTCRVRVGVIGGRYADKKYKNGSGSRVPMQHWDHWLYDVGNHRLLHDRFNHRTACPPEWRGGIDRYSRIGFEVNLYRGTLSLFLDGHRQGLLVHPNSLYDIDEEFDDDYLSENSGRKIAPLIGPLRWAVGFHLLPEDEDASVQIVPRSIPPTVTAAERASDDEEAIKFARKVRAKHDEMMDDCFSYMYSERMDDYDREYWYNSFDVHDDRHHDARPPANRPGGRMGDWECALCGEISFAWRNECFGCGASKRDASLSATSMGTVGRGMPGRGTAGRGTARGSGDWNNSSARWWDDAPYQRYDDY